MKAVLLHGYGGVEQLEFTDTPTPVPLSDEVLVKVISSSINPIDFKLREGKLKAFMPLQFPCILGRDVCGEVTEVGDAVTNFAVGDIVIGLVDHSYAEYLVAKASSLTTSPQGLDTTYAGVLPLVGLTGAQLIESGVKPNASDVVLVTGAMGGVGRSAVFVAMQHGAMVIAGVRATQKTEALSIGANRVVALDDDAEIADLPTLDAIADTVGGPTLAKLLSKLKSGGTLATVVGKPSDMNTDVRVQEIFAHPDPNRLHKLAEDARDGNFSIPIDKRFSLAQIREAQTVAESGGRGKISIRP